MLSIVCLLSLFAALTGCSSVGCTPTPSAAASAFVSSSVSASTSSQTGNLVSIENFKFNPDVIIIKAGDTVEWKNIDSAAHTVVFDTFKSDSISQGASYKHTFTAAGSFSYICGVHPTMKGKVEVK